MNATGGGTNADTATVTLWTIQDKETFAAWWAHGRFIGAPNRVDEDFRAAYGWLAHKMRRRLPPAPPDCAVPVWAWFQARSADRPRPDLRRGGHLPRGQAGVRLMLEVEADNMLLSDFDLWHYVLNDWFLPDAVADDAGPSHSLAQRRASWRRIFDLDFAPEGIADPRAQKSIQATLWELHRDQVTEVRHFVARWRAGHGPTTPPARPSRMPRARRSLSRHRSARGSTRRHRGLLPR